MRTLEISLTVWERDRNLDLTPGNQGTELLSDNPQSPMGSL
ncbi:MAG: hypothetical protein AAFY20_17680 [Cyanobacteria bacterium J06639_14]